MKTAFEEVMEIRGAGPPEDGEVEITGADPVFSTRFKIGETCASVLAGIGVAASDIWRLKTGRRQKTAIDARPAAATLRSAAYLQRPGPNGAFDAWVNEEHEAMRRITQPWPTKDGRWFLPHFGLPNLKARVLGVLGCEPYPDSVAKAVGQWNALDLEAAIDEARACGAMVRANAEWLDHPHGQVLKAKPIVEIIKIADSEPEPFPEGERPLSGIRALDLTRILAGPIAARTLAEHGADVLMVTAEGLPQIAEHVMDTNHGKRSCFLDLKTAEDAARMKELVRGADGPFSHRAGWEQVAQTVTGICNEGGVDQPRLLPAAACDYTTGYLGAYGVLLALARRAREGGSYHVRVSLCQSGMFIYRQGKTEFDEADMDLSDAELAEIRIETNPALGPLRHLGPVLKLSESQPHWSRPTPVLGGDAPEWLDAAAAAAAAE